MIERMNHVGIVVDDLPAAAEFFVELGLELQGEGPPVEGRWVDRVVGLDGVRAEIAVVQTPNRPSEAMSCLPAISHHRRARKPAGTLGGPRKRQ